MTVRSRVLIDWDWEANGLWLISLASGVKGESPPVGRAGLDRLWSELLSGEVLNDLKQWNDSADQLYGPQVSELEPPPAPVFRYVGTQLAQRVQAELGSDWQVLYNPHGDGWAWTWVLPPWN